MEKTLNSNEELLDIIEKDIQEGNVDIHFVPNEEQNKNVK